MNALELYTMYSEYCMDCEWEGETPLSYPAWLAMWQDME